MTETNPTECPECGTVHRSDAPFCENCGFRLGRPDTEIEGHRSLPRHPRRAIATTETEHPAVAPSRRSAATAVEGLSPVPRRGADAVDGHHTFNEGLHSLSEPSVPTERGIAPVSAGDKHDSFIPPSERSGLTQMTLESEQPSRAVVWGSLWMASLAAVAMSVWFYAQPGESGADADRPIEIGPTSIEVPAGPFLEGLDEQVRAFILTACLNQSEDKDLCDQDKLLAGEFPEKTVELPAFRIDANEVTHEQWRACVSDGACEPVDTKTCRVYTHQGLQTALRVPKSLLEPEVPVTCVTRAEAEAYCAAAGGALPTHAQWERAARGTDGRLFPWGVSWESDAANWGELDVARVAVVGKIDGYEWAAPPGRFPAGNSPTGARDMAGNVAEWVAGSDPIRGTARGGSWASNPFDLRTTGRLELKAAARRADVGFRCAYPN